MNRFLVALFFLLNCTLVHSYMVLALDKNYCLAQFFADRRRCICLRNTQTHILEDIRGSNVKLFRSSDCTGSYGVLKKDQRLVNAEWVNSMSFGSNTGHSSGPEGCPNHMPKKCR